MKDKRILYVSSEVVPYLPETEIASTAFNVAKKAHSKGVQTRIFMPRFGVINERRHQLHEVIRLSGMNLIINDMDMPLIIKVASIPKERMQVYFIDNDEYFKNRLLDSDKKKKLYDDNDERAIFFAKGVVETIKKLNWTPDIIHVHGWIASLMPLYLKQYYKDEPLFSKSKVVTSIYDNEIIGNLSSGIINKIKFDEVESETLNVLKNPTYENLYKLSIMNSDGVVFASENIKKSYLDVAANSKIPVLKCGFKDGFEKEYMNFYNDKILN